MKQLATIGAVALLLLVAAVYLSTEKKSVEVPTVVEVIHGISENTPITKGRVDGTLTLNSAISNGYLAAGGIRDLYATIDVDAQRFSNGTRPPLNIAVVMDRSGSMSGDKIEKARAAARQLVNLLNSNDRVAIVSYGSDVSVDFPSQSVTSSNRQSLLNAINNVHVGGGTNLSGGFQRGFSEVSKWKTKKTINRVILMSDGHANVGITHSPSLVNLSTKSLKERVSVTTMGVGLDYNEDLMTQMANEGSGNYYFVDRAEQIVSFFNTELKGLSTTVASNTSIVLELRDGVILSELHGFPHEIRGNKIFISLAEFYSEQKKSILLKFAANANVKGDKPIYTVSLSYDDLIKKKPENQSLKLASIVTNDASKVETQVNVDVISRVQQIEVANSLKTAMDAYQDGNADEATKIIERSQNRMRKSRKKYKFKKAAKYDSEFGNLEKLKRDIKAKPSPVKAKRMIKQQKARSNSILLDRF